MIVTVICPHCRTKTVIDTHWIKKQYDRINCSGCGNSYPAHLWEIEKKPKKAWRIA